jgi:glucosamine 6-phosphate synthetase-like amidotransferase/phosphosugar isomerase protein
MFTVPVTLDAEIVSDSRLGDVDKPRNLAKSVTVE